MKPGPSTTAHAILGLLRLRSWTTYELAKQVQRSLNWFWPRAERKLYDEPKALVAAGLATATSETTGKRPRTVYRITDAGREQLQNWLSEPSSPRSAEFEAMVKIFYADAGSLGQMMATLREIHDEAAGRIAQLGGFAAAVDGQPMFPERLHISALTLRLQMDQEQSILRWAAWAQEQVAYWAATDDPGGWDTHAVLQDVVDDSRAAAPVET